MNREPWRKNSDLSNDDICSKHVAEILWSSGNNYCEKQYLAQTFTNFSETEESLSSSSWGYDDYEIKSVKKITSSLDAIEEALYTGVKGQSLNDELYKECQKWAGAFPHLRIKGEQIIAPSDFDAGGSENNESCIKSPEELATNEKGSGKEYSVNLSYIKEKVVERLALQLWTNCVSEWKLKQSDDAGGRQYDSLPPISSEILLPPRKLKSLQSSDFPKLDGVLTVSPKILLPRADGKIFRVGTRQSDVDRPKFSAMSSSFDKYSTVFRCTPDINNSFQDRMSHARRSNGRAIDIMPLHQLSPREEDLPYSGLQGMHIEPENKEIKPRLFPFESSLILSKPPNFLPPIDDKTHALSFTMSDVNRPISYESRITSGKSLNQPNIYTRHLNRMSARSSTSKLKIAMKSKQLTNPFANNTRLVSNDNNLVNLLPIVTSKELTEKKKTAKRSVSSAFSQRESS